MSDHPAIPLVLERKKLTSINIVVGGGLSPQVCFLQDVLGGEAVYIEEIAKVGDTEILERLVVPRPQILVVPNQAAVVLADDTLHKISIWSTGPIRKRTAALRAITRKAMTILGITELPEDRLDLIGDLVITQCGEEAPPQAMLWEAIWALTDPAPAGPGEKFWKHPWEDPWKWMPPRVALPYRLNALYRDLGAWVFARDDNKKGAEMMGCSPSKFMYLKDIRIDTSKVDQALVALSAWRARPDNGYSTALQIGAIFER